jgi:hypothetical protein
MLCQEVMYTWADGLKKCIFRPTKCRICYHRSPRNLEPSVSRNLRKHIFRPSKCLRVTQRKQDTFDSKLSWPLKNHIYMWPKCRSSRHEASSPGVKDFKTQQESHFSQPKWWKVARRSYVLFRQGSHDPWINSISGRQNAEQRLCGC